MNSSLFSEEMLNATIADNAVENNGPVKVLGIEFANDDERRAYFREELRKKLPELKQIEGFPIGNDDDIVNLSDPPYYTACPNPWLNEFIKEWELEKNHLITSGKSQETHNVKTPYAEDVSTGKYNSIYFKHPYHTKVPIAAISQYLNHYTQDGDIVLDGFAGTGMTGVAAQVTDKLLNSITIDLSPIASYINYYYNYPLGNAQCITEFNKIVKSIHERYDWLYTTKHTNGENGKIESVIWSEAYKCPNCSAELIFWNSGVDIDNGKVLNKIHCSHCNAEFTKSEGDKVMHTVFDTQLDEVVEEVKLFPVRISYRYNNKSYYKIPDEHDIALLKKIDDTTIPSWVPTSPIHSDLAEISRVKSHGYNYIHQLYFKRSLCVLSLFNELCMHTELKGILTSIAFRTNKRYALTYMAGKWGAGGGPTNGTYYIPSLIKELNVFDVLESALTKCTKAYFDSTKRNLISTQSSTIINIPDNSIDYIFTDPPFGGNFIYSELNYVWESWLRVYTDNKQESITSSTYGKGISEYRSLMTSVFKEYYRVLKPGKWITVEFSNTQSSVWNALRMSLQDAGFIICNVATLDKQKGSFVSQTTSTAVKQDLVISAYKISDSTESKEPIKDIGQFDIWGFIREYLDHLPIQVIKNNKSTTVVERTPKVLYDRLVSFCISKLISVPIDAADFQKGLRDYFVEKDGMFFNVTQLVEYEEAKKIAPELVPMGLIVSNEADGIEWLRNRLRVHGPQTYQQIQPEWMQAINGLRKNDILPELKDLLYENFIEEADGKWRLPNVQDDVDKAALRTKALLKEFKIYVEVAQKPKAKLKEVRVEAVRAGFKQCYIDKDFQTIVTVGDKIPQNLLTEDEILLQFYDIAINHV